VLKTAQQLEARIHCIFPRRRCTFTGILIGEEMFNRGLVLAVAAASLVTLFGCATSPPGFDATVSIKQRFDQQESPVPKSFEMMRANAQYADLRWRDLANAVRSALTARGLKEVPAGSGADAVVVVSTQVSNQGSPGATYVPPVKMAGNSPFAAAFNAASGGGNIVQEPDRYSHSVMVSMFPQVRGTTPVEPLYQGYALTVGGGGIDPDQITAALVHVLLDSFPEKSKGFEQRHVVVLAAPK
jgi:hypothetical protein